jgi:hypothetical protein
MQLESLGAGGYSRASFGLRQMLQCVLVEETAWGR